jgi:translation initiation factor IF-3
VKTKEIKLRVRTEEHDLQVKVKYVRRFLEDGDRVRVVVQMRGREQAHPHLAQAMLDKVICLADTHGRVMTPAKLEGRDVFCVLMPKPGGPTKTTRM